jgi:hypothetical protein
MVGIPADFIRAWAWSASHDWPDEVPVGFERVDKCRAD